MNRLVALACLFAAACSTTEAAPAQPVTAKPAASTDHQALCVEVMTRNRTCTDTYIPALVDARARHDLPAGIKAEVAADRAAVIAQANQEWATDSTDQAIAGMCARVPADATQEADTARACLAQAECAAYTACIMPVFEKRLAK